MASPPVSPRDRDGGSAYSDDSEFFVTNRGTYRARWCGENVDTQCAWRREVFGARVSLTYLCHESLRTVKQRAEDEPHEVPQEVLALNSDIFDGVPALDSSAPIAVLRLGKYGGLALCHEFVLDFARRRMQSVPSHVTASVPSLVESVSNLDCHPELVRCFVLACYDGLQSRELSTPAFMLYVGWNCVMLALGSPTIRNDFVYRPANLRTSIAFWIAYIDPLSKSLMLSAMLASILAHSTGSYISNTATKLESAVRGWQLSRLNNLLVLFLPNYERATCLDDYGSDLDGGCERQHHIWPNSRFAEMFGAAPSRVTFANFIPWKQCLFQFAKQEIYQQKVIHAPDVPSSAAQLPSGVFKHEYRTIEVLTHDAIRALVPPDFTVVLPVSTDEDGGPVDKEERIDVHSWVLLQWPYFRRMMAAKLSEHSTSEIHLPQEFPRLLVYFILGALYGMDVTSTMETGNILRTLDHETKMYLLENAQEFELVPVQCFGPDSQTFAASSSTDPGPRRSVPLHDTEVAVSRFQTVMMVASNLIVDQFKEADRIALVLLRPSEHDDSDGEKLAAW